MSTAPKNRLASLIALALYLCAPARAFAEHVWNTDQHQRRQQLVQIANERGYDMGTASEHTTWHFNDTLKPESWIPKEAIRITDYATWGEAAKKLGPLVIGAAVTPHPGGPHLYLVAGDWLKDSIDKQAHITYREGYHAGTKTRQLLLGEDYGVNPRIFFLWGAPAGALSFVGQRSASIIDDDTHKREGYNCAVLVAKTLGLEGEESPTSPFHHRSDELVKLQGDHFARTALYVVGKRAPDLVVQVVNKHSLDEIRDNWEGHHIELEYNR